MAELQYVDTDEVDEDGDVSEQVLGMIPNHAHHFKVRSELSTLVEQDVLTNEQSDQVYDSWRQRRQ